VLVLPVLVSGCASNEPLAYDPATAEAPAPPKPAPRAQAPQPTAEAEYVDERPAFFLEWKGGDLPGLTQRPSRDPTSPLPDYPASSVRNREQGTTVLNACVTTEGRLVDVHLAQSSGYPRLDEATVIWAKKTKYKPAMFGDEALAVCNFRLEYVWSFKNLR
jgi:protein TonB